MTIQKEKVDIKYVYIEGVSNEETKAELAEIFDVIKNNLAKKYKPVSACEIIIVDSMIDFFSPRYDDNNDSIFIFIMYKDEDSQALPKLKKDRRVFFVPKEEMLETFTFLNLIETD